MNDTHSPLHAYVVGALTSPEAKEFETHLLNCPDCSKEVAEMRDLTARLSESVAAEPPPALRSAIMASIAQTPQDAPIHLAEAAPVASVARGRHAAPMPATAEAPPSNVVQLRRRPWAARTGALVAAAAVLGAVGFGGWAIQSRDDARRDAQVATERTGQLAQVLAAGDAKTKAGVFAGGGSAAVVRSQDKGLALLVADDLPALPDGSVYEAWTVDEGSPVPAGTFGADGGESTLVLPDAALKTETIAVTVEPEGGSDAPTSDLIFVVKL